MKLQEFLDKLLERNVEIKNPTPTDKWGLRINVNGKEQTFAQLQDTNWQVAIKEVIGWIRKNLNYEDFKADKEPMDLQFKSDGTVVITSDTGTIEFQGKQVPSVKYKLSAGLASKIGQLLVVQK